MKTKPEIPCYVGTHAGVDYRIGPARYANGKASIQLTKAKSDGFKGPAERLLDALNARWSRRCGYIIAPSRATQWRALFLAGWDAGIDWRGSCGCTTPPLFESPSGENMTLAQALARISNIRIMERA